MIKNVFIYGAGSIGNHYAFASRSLGLNVSVCDLNSDALKRMMSDIYPTRYGSWDESIVLKNNFSEITFNNEDIVLIGTPPESRLSILKEVLKNGCKHVLLEKPFGIPDDDIERVLKEYEGVSFYSGYNHVVSLSFQSFLKDIQLYGMDGLKNIKVKWCEPWDGIMGAHFWLDSIFDTYLGYSSRGGGAMSAHSHGLNLGLFLLNHFDVFKQLLTVDFIKDETSNYDQVFELTAEGKSGVILDVRQDTIAKETIKSVSLEFYNGEAKIIFGSESDEYLISSGTKSIQSSHAKTRPDDFITQLQEIMTNKDIIKESFQAGILTHRLISDSWQSFHQN